MYNQSRAELLARFVFLLIMRAIKIGCLLPLSGVMPAMSKDFKKGLELGMAKTTTDIDIEIIPELINQGQIKNTSEAINKLTNYHDVDLLTGIVSSLVIKELFEVINSRKIPFIYNNVGEHVPSKQLKSPYLFHNSLLLWKSQWSIGRWAQEQHGGTAALCLSVYDAGYHLHEAFRLGAVAAGASSVYNNVLPLVPNQVDTSVLIRLIEQQQPTHVHAILCGVDGKDFIRRYHEADLMGKIPLTACPFLVEDELSSDIENYISEIPNSVSWSYSLSNKVNKTFIKSYETAYCQKPSVFSLLGFESGLEIIKAMDVVRARGISLEKALAEITIESPRGTFSFQTGDAGFNMFLRKPKLGTCSEVLAELSSVTTESPELAIVVENSISGWQNPYLCI